MSLFERDIKPTVCAWRGCIVTIIVRKIKVRKLQNHWTNGQPRAHSSTKTNLRVD